MLMERYICRREVHIRSEACNLLGYSSGSDSQPSYSIDCAQSACNFSVVWTK